MLLSLKRSSKWKIETIWYVEGVVFISKKSLKKSQSVLADVIIQKTQNILVWGYGGTFILEANFSLILTKERPNHREKNAAANNSKKKLGKANIF